VAERERHRTPPYGGVFDVTAEVMNAADVRRAIKRIAHEILERNQGNESLVLVGLQTGGVELAEALAATIEVIEGSAVPVGTLDVAFHRDDVGLRPVLPAAETSIPCDLTEQCVVLVDDVLFTGRTIRAALDAIHAFGRPRCIRLAVMVDRGHRELPIKADYVGKNIPTSRAEMVDVHLSGVNLGEVKR
jgi:pyrimidine operon attenuation protein / uracil phosphoribosyltransferase